jgi:alkanesulfonate monooxygenase SsuD/methylene tetrahydromethanopterin reductase-like flavin-dependent oxidoreductase (luciferase family)
MGRWATTVPRVLGEAGESPTSGLGLWLAPAGVSIAPPAVEDLAQLGGVLEANGFDWLWLSDPAPGDRPAAEVAYEPFTLAGALASVTDRLRLGVVPSRDRLPSMLVKLATTLDVISHGRAGLALRIDEPQRADAVDRAAEGLQVCRTMFDDDRPTFAGRFYRVDGAVNRPRPSRPGGLPMVLFADDGGLSPTSSSLPNMAPLVDGLVVGGDPRSTTGWVERIREVAPAGGHVGHGVSLIWATPPVAAPGDPVDPTQMEDLADQVRRQRTAGVRGILVRMAGFPAPEVLAEIAGWLGDPVGS